MNPIIEKIARVIYENDVQPVLPWESLSSDTTQEYYRRIARGAVEALGLTEQVDVAWLRGL